MSNDNQPPGYYTPIDGRIYGPVTLEKPVAPDTATGKQLHEFLISVDEHYKYLKALPSYAVSPDLLLKERMVENLDFRFDTVGESPYQPFYKPYGMSDEEYDNEVRIAEEKLAQWENESKIAVPIKYASLDNAGKVEGEADILIALQKELKKINPDIKTDSLIECSVNILNVMRLDGTIESQPRSFTSKDMEDFAERIDDSPYMHSTHKDDWWLATNNSQRFKTSDLLKKFINRDYK